MTPSPQKTREPALHVVLVEPQIPPNTGNIARLCAGAGCRLILLGKLGFKLDDAHLKRAGLDYWDFVDWEHHLDSEGYLAELPPHSAHFFTTHSDRPYTQMPVVEKDYLVFGKETAGLPKALLEAHPQQCYTIPMVETGVRSFNLSSAVAIVTYDALRRLRQF